MDKVINNILIKLKSILNNIVFLDIETTGNNINKDEIIEIGMVKVENEKITTFNKLVKPSKEIPIEVYGMCKGLSESDFNNAHKLREVEKRILEFVDEKLIICSNLLVEGEFLKRNIKYLENEIIDLQQLAFILEPYHKEYSLEYLKKQVTRDKDDLKNRALNDAIDLLKVVNALIVRLNSNEESTLEPLYFKVNSYLSQFHLEKWRWSELIENVEYDKDDYINEVVIENVKTKKNPTKKDKETFKKIYEQGNSYEELLKDQDIWASKEGFMYEYRPGQYELTKTIRQTINRSINGANIACIEAPTGIGKSVGYLVPAILEARLYSKRIIISTDTKELQIQLINKDIPNVLNSLGLNNKVKYGYIKGKNNYICVEKLESYKHEYLPNNPTKEDVLSMIILERLVEEGKYGDIEEISDYILNYFKETNTHLKYIACDPNLCRPKNCFKECLYKKRVEELKEEDITVINHSLLARWPYKEEKPLEHIIVDEGHNLVEKGYDFFSSAIEYKAFNYFLQEIYPYENMQSSKFIVGKNKSRKIKAFDKFYHHCHFDRSIKDKISRNINIVVEEIQSILEFGLSSDYRYASRYNLRWELNLQSGEVCGKVNKDNKSVELKYEAYSEKIKLSCETIIRNLASILLMIERNIDDDSIDKEADVYKFGKARIKELEDVKTTVEQFMEYSEDDDFARIVEVTKDFDDFSISVVPLKLAQLFEENILSQVESAVFLSATLSVENKMDYFKNTLGINKVNSIEKIIPPLYDYKNRVSIIGINDLCSYINKEFTSEMGQVIHQVSQVTSGHMLSLFNSRDRLEKTYENLLPILHNQSTEIYTNKKGIKYLKDIKRKCVVLGSKGCFEGVDVPGDGLTCVTLDKIPNLNPRDALYSTVMKKYNLPYHVINYPQMTIKIKQAMGRLLRSKYDYGCFIVFNTGTNNYTLKKLERDLHGCKINMMSKNRVSLYISKHLYESRKIVMNQALIDIINVFKNKNINKIDEFMNIEMKNRYINSHASYIENGDIKVKYFNQNYLIPKIKFKK